MVDAPVTVVVPTRISDQVWIAVIAGVVTILTTLMTLVLSQVNQVHNLVNSSASAAQAKIDSAAVEIAALRGLVMQMQVSSNPGSPPSVPERTP